MNKGLYSDKPLSVFVREFAEEALLPNQVRVHTEFASIKHGTEFALFSGQSPFHGRHFDSKLQLFVEDAPDRPPSDAGQFLGNTFVGTVIEIGKEVTKISSGDRVYGYGPACETVTAGRK